MIYTYASGRQIRVCDVCKKVTQDPLNPDIEKNLCAAHVTRHAEPEPTEADLYLDYLEDRDRY